MNLKSKLSSRKFWISIAALLGSIGVSVSGITTANQTVTAVGIACAVLSAAIYAACEAYVDAAAVEKKVIMYTDASTNEESEDE